MRELKARNLSALYRLLTPGDDRITYETLRLLYNGHQRGTRDVRVPRDLALMLKVSENEIRQAMRVEPNYGRFEIPDRAQGLAPDERKVVVSVIDAILTAKRGGQTWVPGTAGSEESKTGSGPIIIDDAEELRPRARQKRPDLGPGR